MGATASAATQTIAVTVNPMAEAPLVSVGGPVTVTEGTNQLVGRDPERIVKAARAGLDTPPAEPGQVPCRPAGWDGQASQRIAAVLVSQADRQKR